MAKPRPPKTKSRFKPKRPLRPRAGKSTRPSKRPGKKPQRPKSAPFAPPPLGPDTVRPLALAAIEGALDRKAEDPVLLDVRRISSYADYVLLLSADSERQVEAIADSIEAKVKAHGGRLRSLEAAGESNWLLMDFGDLVVHIFFRDARGFYDLEGLWSDAPRVPLGAAAGAAARS